MLSTLATTAFLSGCINISADSSVEAPKGSTVCILKDRVAQSISTEYNMIKEITFDFKGCNGQIIKLTTEQTYNNIEPSDFPYYFDTETLALGQGDCSLTFTDFDVSYHTNMQYWFQLQLMSGDPVELYLSDKNYDGGIATKNDGSGWVAVDKDLAFNIIWIGEEPDDPPSQLIEYTFSTDTSRTADLYSVETSNANLYSYVLERQYRIHRVKGVITLSSYSGSAGMTFAMAYTATYGLGQLFHDISINYGYEPIEFDIWPDQNQLESNLVGGVFQTYFAYNYEMHGTIYVTEDCRSWDTTCQENTG